MSEWEAEMASARENAMRQLAHLGREIDCGYPPAVIRSSRQAANRAVTNYVNTVEAWMKEQRAARREQRRALRVVK